MHGFKKIKNTLPSASYLLPVISANRGFTLIELLIVFSVVGVISTISIASYVSYSNKQTLQGAILDIRSMLELARSRALTQIKTSNCNGKTFNGYRVLICASNPSCLSTKDYEINVECNGSFYLVNSSKLPSGVSVASSTTSKSFFFTPLSGVVVGSGHVDLQMTGQSNQTITVQSTGAIQ